MRSFCVSCAARAFTCLGISLFLHLACSPLSILAPLRNAAIYGRTCWSAAETPICGPRSVPGWLCPRLDSVRPPCVSGRCSNPLARAPLVLAGPAFLGGLRDHLRHPRGVPVQPPQGMLPQLFPSPVQILPCSDDTPPPPHPHITHSS